MREVELKAAVDDAGEAIARLVAAGATRTFSGRLEDRRYDTADRALAARDDVLRLRVYRDAEVRAFLDFKGPTSVVDGYKVREEHSVTAGDPGALATILTSLGYQVTREIDRDIEQYVLAGATVRFERYPRMDVLVEVEGTPRGIEASIAVLGIPRASFTSVRLLEFVRAFEARTGARAAVSEREFAGDYRFSSSDA